MSSIFNKKNVLVAGGAGFIGSNLCDQLIKDSQVICIDNFSSSNTRKIEHLLPNPNFVFINHDLSQVLDLGELPELNKFKVAYQGVQEIYNLACPMSVRNFEDNREKIILANSAVVKNLLDLAVKYKSKFMQFSSSVVYGLRGGSEELNKDNKISEEFLGISDFLSDRACYDEGKRFAETIVNTYAKVFNLSTKIVRLFRTYGPRMSLEDDQMIPDFVNNALSGKDLTILGDKDFSSSLCYVDDVIDAVFKVMASDLSGPFNIGSEENVSLVEVAQKIIEYSNSNSKIVFGDSKLFMTELLIPNAYKIRNELNWMPVVSLEKGLGKTILDLQVSRQAKKYEIN